MDCPSHPLTHEFLCFYHLWRFQRTYARIFLTIGTLMYLAGCGVNRDILKIRLHRQNLKNCLKDPHFPPLPKTGLSCLPGAISWWKFSPRCPSSDNPQQSIHPCALITLCRASTFPFFPMFRRQQSSDPFPFTFCQFIVFRFHTISLHSHLLLCNFYFSNTL